MDTPPPPTRIALVTGASSGIGRACAIALLREGWTVWLIGRRAQALQEAIAQAALDRPDVAARAHPVVADI
ncbi:MAG: SDR family NAD(P)-dependent oxidoreductase, partial [Hydrogenophilus thermoluteolus]